MYVLYRQDTINEKKSTWLSSADVERMAAAEGAQ